jgi:chloramphenicol 3-O-phosphotransferase
VPAGTGAAADVLVLTGPPAAGKTTVAQAVADRLERAAVVEVDALRAMVRRGHVAAWYPGEGTAQHRLGARHACLLARGFVGAGFKVVVADLLTEETLPLYRAGLAGLPVRVVRLLPSLEEAQRRNRARGRWVTPARVALLYAQQAALAFVGETLDTTALPAAAVAARLAPLLGASAAGGAPAR